MLCATQRSPSSRHEHSRCSTASTDRSSRAFASTSRERGSAEEIVAALTDRAFAIPHSLQPEYLALLRDRFGDLDDDDRRAVLAVVAAGAGIELPSEPDDHEALLQRIDYWRLRRYHALARYLDGDARAQYN